MCDIVWVIFFVLFCFWASAWYSLPAPAGLSYKVFLSLACAACWCGATWHDGEMLVFLWSVLSFVGDGFINGVWVAGHHSLQQTHFLAPFILFIIMKLTGAQIIHLKLLYQPLLAVGQHCRSVHKVYIIRFGYRSLLSVLSNPNGIEPTALSSPLRPECPGKYWKDYQNEYF